jgi:predicted MFS family arabinose efflux permease
VPLATPATAAAFLIASQAITGLSNMVYNINQVSLRQSITPQRLLGRMNATMRFIVWGTMPVGSLMGGALGEWLGLRPALLVAAAGSLFAFLWILFSPVRTLREQPAPADDQPLPSQASERIALDKPPVLAYTNPTSTYPASAFTFSPPHRRGGPPGWGGILLGPPPGN